MSKTEPTTSTMLSRDDFLEKATLPWELVTIPELGGGAVYVQGLRASERDAFEARRVTQNGSDVTTNFENMRAELVTLTCVDKPGGQRIFTEEDVEALGNASAKVIQRLFNAASRLSGMDNKDLEDLAKNYTPAQNADLRSS